MTNHEVESSDLEGLVALGVVRSYPRNTIVFQEGDKGDQLFVIASGKVKVYLADSEGKENIVDVLSAGQYFGEMALDGAARSASVMTTEAPPDLIALEPKYERPLMPATRGHADRSGSVRSRRRASDAHRRRFAPFNGLRLRGWFGRSR